MADDGARLRKRRGQTGGVQKRRVDPTASAGATAVLRPANGGALPVSHSRETYSALSSCANPARGGKRPLIKQRAGGSLFPEVDSRFRTDMYVSQTHAEHRGLVPRRLAPRRRVADDMATSTAPPTAATGDPSESSHRGDYKGHSNKPREGGRPKVRDRLAAFQRGSNSILPKGNYLDTFESTSRADFKFFPT